MDGCSLLLEINMRAWVRAASQRLGRAATIDDIPDAALDRLAAQGFTWVWLLGVWRTGEAGRGIARAIPELRATYRRALPDLREEDICGSCFAVSGYEVERSLGGKAALERLRERLHRRGLSLMLDFVPNHTATDHPWVRTRPELYRAGSAADLAREPHNYVRIEAAAGPRILAHGRDPNFPGWTDTLQLDYANPQTLEAVRGELFRIAGQCDGLRCDMTMLLLPEVFARTWGAAALPFWPEAIAEVRRAHPRFEFLAEAYWDLEWTLLQQGFDHAYDKRLYDRLRAGTAGPVRDHLRADLNYQRRLARFLENHDEERAATAFADRHRAAALLTYLAPGLRFFQDGQIEGRRVRLPVQLCRAPEEPLDGAIARFYAGLLALLRSPPVRRGDWRLLEQGEHDAIAYDWQAPQGRLVLLVNFGAGRCRSPMPPLDGRVRQLDPDGWREEPPAAGLEIELPAWGARVLVATPE